jgi:hypothetical protein
MLFEVIPTPIPAAAAPRRPAEPAAVGVLVYPGVGLEEIAAPFRRLATIEHGDGAACSVALVGPSLRPVALPSGRALGIDHALGAGAPVFDLFVATCGFAAAPAFETVGAIRPLLEAVRTARRVLLLASRAPLARRAHLLLRSASTQSAGAFWNATRSPDAGPLLIEDGRLTWAIGPDAAAVGIARVAPDLAAMPAA